MVLNQITHTTYSPKCGPKSNGGGRVVQWCLVSFMPGCPTNLDYSMARPTAVAVGAGGVVWTFFL